METVAALNMEEVKGIGDMGLWKAPVKEFSTLEVIGVEMTEPAGLIGFQPFWLWEPRQVATVANDPCKYDRNDLVLKKNWFHFIV